MVKWPCDFILRFQLITERFGGAKQSGSVCRPTCDTSIGFCEEAESRRETGERDCTLILRQEVLASERRPGDLHHSRRRSAARTTNKVDDE